MKKQNIKKYKENTQNRKISRIRKYTMETNEKNIISYQAYKMFSNVIRTRNFLHSSRAYY